MAGWIWRTAIAAAAMLAAGVASAQTFPAKAVHILVPYPPGGGVDVLTRTLADVVSKNWGQSIVVENRPGAGGVIASQAIATAVEGEMPDAGQLLTLFLEWTPDATARHRILVDNPAKLYDFPN
jgi:tripartite-type tricarboxylate transporter receptor subunit TctC